MGWSGVRRRRWAGPLLLTLLITACSDGGGDTDVLATTTTTDQAADSATTTARAAPTTTTGGETDSGTADSPDTTTTAPPAGSDMTISDTITTETGIDATYSLNLEGETLCFTLTLDHDDPALAADLGGPVEECLDGDTPVARFDGAMSASVGTAGGLQRVGYVWGRTTPDAALVEIRFAAGAPIQVLPTDASGFRIFAAVIDTGSRPEAATLEALDADGTSLDSLPIRGFLRSGPTYPVVTTPTAPPPTYPSTGG